MNVAKRPKLEAEYGQKKNNYKKKFIEVGQRGFLATCNFREKDCVRESYNVLNQYADELYGPPEPTHTALDEDNIDIADDLQKQIEVEKANGKTPKKRFQMLETGTTNCIFIRTTLPDPVELSTRIVKDIASSGQAKSRYLLRLVPIEVICKANVGDITAAAGKLFDKYFLKEPTTFAIVFNKRYNNDLSRDDVIHDLAALVQEKNHGNKVNLKQSAKTVLVEVLKGLCCLSVVEGYLQHKKYNLVELANVKTAIEKEKLAEKLAAANAGDQTKEVPTNGGATGESKEKKDEDSKAEVEQVQ